MLPDQACTSCRRLRIECVTQNLNKDAVANNDNGSLSRSSGEDEDDEALRGQSQFQTVSMQDSSGTYVSRSISPHSAPELSGAGFMSHRSALDSRSLPKPMTLDTQSVDLQPASLSQSDQDSASSLTPLTYQNGSGANTLTTIFGDFDTQFNGRAAFLGDMRPPQTVRGNPASHSSRVDQDKPSRPTYPVTFEQIEAVLPAEDLAISLIDLYFREIHVYLPVLSRTVFYRDWLGKGRRFMSPILLLSVFAAAARLSDDPRVLARADDSSSRGDLWHKLIYHIREDFHDVPRLDTLQAEIINLKALEYQSENRGFAYRGWYHLGGLVRMGKDLGLHKLSNDVKTDEESNMGRRVWQACFIMDQFMATGQGREFQMDLADIDMSFLPNPPPTDLNLSSDEIRLQNDFVHMATLVTILRRCSLNHASSGIRFPFAAEPQRPILSETLLQWRANLPEHLTFRPTVEKKLPSHFVGNLHLTYCLNVCLLHRAWIVSTGQYGATGEWRVHLRVCDDAARQATILFEMVFKQYGMSGIKCMFRGYNIALYGALIMAMIHAISLTCPEKEFNDGAVEYFTRIMNILDTLAIVSPNPALPRHLATIRSIFIGPQKSNQSSFSLQNLSPDLQNLQQQYELVQRAHDRPKSVAGRQPQYDYRATGFSNQGTRYVPSPTYQNMAFPESEFQHLPMVSSDSMMMAGSQQESSPESLYLSSPGITSWNPAGLIGAWNLNFPMVSGMHINKSTGHLMPDSAILPSTQGIQYPNSNHGQEDYNQLTSNTTNSLLQQNAQYPQYQRR